VRPKKNTPGPLSGQRETQETKTNQHIWQLLTMKRPCFSQTVKSITP